MEIRFSPQFRPADFALLTNRIILIPLVSVTKPSRRLTFVVVSAGGDGTAAIVATAAAAAAATAVM